MESPHNNVAVSVCIPTYNYGHLLGQAIESVLGQTYQDLELIVVDDASTDNTDAVIESFASDKRLRYFKNDPNLGLFKNFNYCATLARGRYLKFLCADDWLDPLFLAETVPTLEQSPGTGLVTCSHFQVDVDGNPIAIEYASFDGRKHVDKQAAIDQLIEWHYVIGRPTNVLMRKSAFDDVGGFDEAFAPTGDLHLWLKILQSYDLGAVHEPRCFVRVHDTKTHSFANDPTEAVFLVWQDAASWAGSLVDQKRLDRAVFREAMRCTVFAISALLGGRTDQAKKIARYTRPHISLLTFMPRFMLNIPRIGLGFATRIIATRSKRYLVFDPYPRLGERINSNQ